MAGNWYLGGVLRTEAQSNAWISDTLRCSLVAGNSVVQNDRGWTTMAEFTGAGNSFITNMTSGTATDVLMPSGRTITYDSVTDTVYWRWPAGRISFGTPASAQNFCGVLIHDGSVSTGSSTIWGYQRVTGATQGGAVEWGEQTVVNDVLTSNVRNTTNSNTGNGFMNGIFNDASDSWSGIADLYEFALIRSGNTVNFRDWYSVQDALNAGITPCTNCEFGGSANPTLSSTYRDNSAYFGTGQYFYYPTVLSGVPGGLKWDGAQLSGGEQAIGILGYINSAGGPSGSQIFMWNDIPSPITLVNGQDVIWDTFDTGARSFVLSYLTGN